MALNVPRPTLLNAFYTAYTDKRCALCLGWFRLPVETFLDASNQIDPNAGDINFWACIRASNRELNVSFRDLRPYGVRGSGRDDNF